MSEDAPRGAGPRGPQAVETGHILIVDDNEVNRDMLARRLVRRGHTVEHAADGRQALKAMAAGAFDLVLLDIMMPDVNGYEVLERMRADDDLHHLPVILISALGDANSLVEGIEKGADDHLPKPFDPRILNARVDACLAKKRLRDREQLYARALAREMDIARDIQAGFLPETLPAPPGWELVARFHPARSVAGDFYDAFPLHDGARVGIAVADVCGKGVGAALFMALFRTLLRSLSDRYFTRHGDPETEARQLVSAVNDYIATTHGRANMFATLFLGIIEPASGELAYVNGGHDAPVIASPDGIREILPPTGPAVGMFPEMTFNSARTTLDPDHTLLVFTDGVVDARADDGSLFTLDRLLGLLDEPPGSAVAILDRIETALQAHAGDASPFDDITLLALHRSGATPRATGRTVASHAGSPHDIPMRHMLSDDA